MPNESTDVWYHGSPLVLKTLRTGSSITGSRELARVFSHKPACVSLKDDGTLHHNGKLNGYLYVVDEPVAVDDVRPHPRSAMDEGLEWLTNRELRLRPIAGTSPRAEERFSAEQLRMLRKRGIEAE